MSSARVIEAGSKFRSAPIQRMPFGKYRGQPLNAVPHEYVEWLLGREIDARLRAALASVHPNPPRVDGKTPSAAASADELPAVVARFLEAREEANEARQRLTDVREELLPLLVGRGGHYVDEASGQRVSVHEQLRWEYDPTRLHGLVDEGVLAEAEFLDCLKTVVDKSIVAGWEAQARVTADQLEHLDARIVVRTIQQVQVRALSSVR